MAPPCMLREKLARSGVIRTVMLTAVWGSFLAPSCFHLVLNSLDRNGQSFAEFREADAVGVDDSHSVCTDGECRELGVDAADAGQAGEWIGALRNKFRCSVFGEQCH